MIRAPPVKTLEQILSMLGGRQDRQAAAARLKTAISTAHPDTRVLWPRLDTISCWMHGPARSPAQELQKLFPQAFLQPKGLLATEGAVSIPLCAASMPVLAVRSGFFEFLDDDDHCHLAHELEPGTSYRVVMTTYSGFYRYDLGDTVLAHGCHRGAPMLEFIGRQGVVSDICGEKLSDAFVSRCLTGTQGFALIAPQQRGYCLFVDSAVYAETELVNLAHDVEAKLECNPQYAYARRIGQLAPLQAISVVRAAETYFERRAALGQSIGDIKPAALSLDGELHSRFRDGVL